MLSFAEDLFLLVLDDHAGQIKALPEFTLDFALAGAVLMDLAIRGRIDIDTEGLHVADPQPTGQAELDGVLAELAAAGGKSSVTVWLQQLSRKGTWIQERILERLVGHGILKREDRRILWVFTVRRYPLVDNREIQDVKTRLRTLILGDDIPDAREAVLVSLVQACNLAGEFLSPQEIRQHRGRLEAIAKLDLIGQQVSAAVSRIQTALASCVWQA